jgi:hypothetical protein
MLRWITARVEADALKRNKDLAFTRTPLSLVRDEGVAGSNPATPTRQSPSTSNSSDFRRTALSSKCDSYGDRLRPR